ACVNRKLVVCTALTATACSFAPEYKRPEAGVPADYRFAQPQEATSVADLPWWQLFRDPTLQDLIRAALANNLDLAVAAARADLAVTTAAIPETELFIAHKEHQICVLLGRAPGPISRGTALVDTPVPPQIPLGVPAQLLSRRPDVLAAEQGVIGAGNRVGVA